MAMRLDEFVSETIKAVVDGVRSATEHCKAQGARVNPADVTIKTEYSSQNQASGQWPQKVKFDVAVTVTEGTGTKGGVGIVVGLIALGSQGKSDASDSYTSRIRFTVPVLLPNG